MDIQLCRFGVVSGHHEGILMNQKRECHQSNPDDSHLGRKKISEFQDNVFFPMKQ